PRAHTGGFSCSRTSEPTPRRPLRRRPVPTSATTSTPARTPGSPRSCWSRKSRSTECAASTSAGTIAMTAPFEPGLGYRLQPAVALGPGPFGARGDPFGPRRVSFLSARALVELVRGLGSHRCVSDALAAVPDARREVYLGALAALAASDMIIPQPHRSEMP